MKILKHKVIATTLLIFTALTVFAQDSGYTLTTVKVIKAPSLKSEISGCLKAGVPVEIYSQSGDLYEIRYQEEKGYIHNNYVGKSYVSVPDIRKVFSESSDSWLLGTNRDASLIVILFDNGWQGAVDGPALNLEVFNYKTQKIIKSVFLEGPGYGGDYNPDFATPERYRQTVLNYAWNHSGKAIQELFTKNAIKTTWESDEIPLKKSHPDKITWKLRQIVLIITKSITIA